MSTDGTTIGTADLITVGLEPQQIHRYIHDRSLQPCAGGGGHGTGHRFEFPPSELVVGRALAAWRGVDRFLAARRIAAEVRHQLAQLDALGELSETVTVDVHLAAGVWLVVEVER